jgi:hypothetical protein
MLCGTSLEQHCHRRSVPPAINLDTEANTGLKAPQGYDSCVLGNTLQSALFEQKLENGEGWSNDGFRSKIKSKIQRAAQNLFKAESR